MLEQGSARARTVAAATLREVRQALGIEYFA